MTKHLNSLIANVVALFAVVAFSQLNLFSQETDTVRNNNTKTEVDTTQKNATVHRLPAEDVLSKRLIEQLGYGGFVITDQNTKISIGGLIIGNAYQDFRTMRSENYFAISEIPIDASSMFRTRFDVGNSRFFINSDIATKELDYRTRFEFDFFNASGDYVFRLRHAFVEFGRFAVGYTFSNFTNTNITPDVIDNGGAPGEVAQKQTQFRYTHPLSATMRFVVAVEDGQGNLLRDNSATASTRISPDFVANFRYKPAYSDNTQFQIAGVLHPLGYKQEANPFAGEFGWAVSAGAAIKLFQEDYLSCQATYSHGATKYLSDPIVFYDARVETNLDSTLTITPIKMFGFFLYYHHRWTEHYASNFGYSYIGGRESQFSSDYSQAIEGHYASANIIYYPNNKMAFGLEPIFGMRKNIDGETAFNFRVQFQVKFSF